MSISLQYIEELIGSILFCWVTCGAWGKYCVRVYVCNGGCAQFRLSKGFLNVGGVCCVFKCERCSLCDIWKDLRILIMRAIIY